MTPRFIGRLDWAPQDASHPHEWRLEEPYGQITRDGYLIICPPWRPVNGASIPRPLWPVLGHPFDGPNRFWSTPHDLGYTRQAIVLDLSKHAVLVLTPESWVDQSDNIPKALHVQNLPRIWWDNALHDGMRICSERSIKRFSVYRAVRLFGWAAWNRLKRGE